MNYYKILLLLALFIQYSELIDLPKIDNEKDDNNLEIIGGETTSHNYFPYIVYLQSSENVYTGSILDQNTIITAGHCGYSLVSNPSDLQVYVGYSDPINQKGAGQIIRASQIIIPSDGYTDLAIVKLSQNIQFNSNVNRICIDAYQNQYQWLMIAGYGQTRGASRTIGSTNMDIDQGYNDFKLRWAIVKEKYNSATCSKDLVCVQPYDNNKLTGTCNGDSGGPLVTPNGKLMGVTSGGDSSKSNGIESFCVGDEYFVRLSSKIDFLNKYGGSYCY